MPVDDTLEGLKRVAARLLNANVGCFEQVSGGRNSQVYRVETTDLQRFALKFYFQHPSDHRDRLKTEFDCLRFLQDCNVLNVPSPFDFDKQHNCAVYEWIEGRRIAPVDVTLELVDTAASFAMRLADLRKVKNAGGLSNASEACFSAHSLVQNIQERLEKLSMSNDRDLKEFLAEIETELDAIVQWSRARLGASFDDELPQEARTLSPSDFGFHNALQKNDGSLVFLDFEYFGWDDPVKLVSDFVLHPAMSVAPELKARFANSIRHYFSNPMPITRRLEALYPLFGLKWCTILLNEFLPEHLLRRRFAALSEVEDRENQSKQLAKARSMLQRIHSEYEHCPYVD